MSNDLPPYVAFRDHQRLAAGTLLGVALATKAAIDADPTGAVLVFESATGRTVELDLRGTPGEVAARVPPPPTRRPGRPRLGVVAREVTLLPRHWDWLARQPGGASVTLRKLVEEAIRTSGGEEQRRAAQEAAFRFMTTVAGDLPGYEEACRALFKGDPAALAARVAAWPSDVRDQILRMAGV